MCACVYCYDFIARLFSDLRNQVTRNDSWISRLFMLCYYLFMLHNLCSRAWNWFIIPSISSYCRNDIFWIISFRCHTPLTSVSIWLFHEWQFDSEWIHNCAIKGSKGTNTDWFQKEPRHESNFSFFDYCSNFLQQKFWKSADKSQFEKENYS